MFDDTNTKFYVALCTSAACTVHSTHSGALMASNAHAPARRAVHPLLRRMRKYDAAGITNATSMETLLPTMDHTTVMLGMVSARTSATHTMPSVKAACCHNGSGGGAASLERGSTDASRGVCGDAAAIAAPPRAGASGD